VSDFAAASVELGGGFTVAAPIDEVFELFSPLGETRWVPGWDPELIHPAGVAWERGLIFRTREETGDAVWIVTALDRTARDVEYYRVEPGRYVARIRVRCTPLGERQTQVATAYTFIGLSPAGNVEIAHMSAAAYDDKMKRWEGWIRERVLQAR
jgi:hypothetical protein